MQLPIVSEHQGRAVTNSRAVAEFFGKNHFDVLKAIKKLADDLGKTEGGRKFNDRNFSCVDYTDSKGEQRPYYILTKDAFTLLVMGFNGSKALAFKLAYIEAFNRMEKALAGQGEILQNIERRLAKLEKMGRETYSPAKSEASTAFIGAVQSAVKSGAYKITPSRFSDAGEAILGVNEGDRIALRATMAYSIYEQATEKPLRRLPLWALLEAEGVILPRDKTPRHRTFNRKQQATIYLLPGIIE